MHCLGVWLYSDVWQHCMYLDSLFVAPYSCIRCKPLLRTAGLAETNI